MRGGVRGLWSSVAQQVESRLLSPVPSHPHGAPPRHSSSSSSTPSLPGRQGRRSKSRGWTRDGGDHSGTSNGHVHNHEGDLGNDIVIVGDPRNRFSYSEVLVPRRNRSRGRSQSQHKADLDRNQNENGERERGRGRTVKMHMRPDEQKEAEAVEMLTALMGDGFDREVARRVLKKYDGNADKAAGALLEGERGEDMAVASGPQSQTSQQQQTAGAGHQAIQIQSQGWPTVGLTGSSASGWSVGSGSGAGLGSGSSQSRLGMSDVPPALGGRPNTPVIDLTLDDDPDLQRAMQESMSTLHASTVSQMYAPSYTTRTGYQAPAQQLEGPIFGPSERPPDPNWAMVPSHQNENSDVNYLQNLNRAIEASLETVGDSDALEPFPVEQQLRRDGRPVVLRPSMHTMVYAASILQGLFYVPQVRVRMACWRPPIPTTEDEATPPMDGPDFTLWALSEIFTHMDLARLCDLNVDKRLPAFSIEPWDRPAQPPGELSRNFFAKLSATLERSFTDQFARDGQPPPKPRLLHFQYSSGIREPGELLQETSIVPIDVHGGESNDLIGRLSAQLSKPQSEPGKQNVIFEPSEVVAFELVRALSTPSATAGTGGGSDRKQFTYPKSIYLDQFLRENVELAQTKRGQRQTMSEEVQRLVLHKKSLTHFDGKDTLKDLRSTIFYFENVADAKGDAERGALIQATTGKLKSILTSIEDGIKVADEKIDTLRTQAETLLDCEELQRFRYDLRVVFVHDGLYGRKHLYSYVHDKSCWWKIADSLIEKVPEETVLNDQTGLHLGAGPYLLFYSRAMESEYPALPLPWMDDIKDDVRVANREFLSQLPPDLIWDIALDEDVSSARSGGVAGEKMDVSP